MINPRSIGAAAATLSAVFGTAAGLVLEDLPHNDGPRYSKRGDPMGCLDLRSQETFLWGAADENQAALGNLTVYMPDEQENIISMERFHGMLDSVNCSETTIDMAFRDDYTFEYAKEVWDWVNGDDNHTFVMVAGRGACGWNEGHRQPFTVSTLVYDDNANVAHLTAIAQNWTEAIHTYDLNVGAMPPQDLQKRGFGEIDYNKDLSLDFNHQFPVDTVSLPMPDGVTATLDMSNCSTAGAFAFQFTLETVLLIPKKAEMSVHPQGVSITVAPSLELTGNITEPKTGDLTLARINLVGIQIPAGILDIGPEIILSVGATIDSLQGQATIEAGVVYSLDDSAVATIDVFDASASQSGWTPNVQTTPLTVNAELTASVKAFVKAELALVAKAFSTGFDLGIGLSPYLAADMQTVTAQSGTCGASDGLEIDPSYGVDLILDAHSPGHDQDNPLFSITLASLSEPLPNICLPFGDTGVVAASATVSPTSSDVAPTSSIPAIAISASTSSILISRAAVSSSSAISSPSSISKSTASISTSLASSPSLMVTASSTMSARSRSSSMAVASSSLDTSCETSSSSLPTASWYASTLPYAVPAHLSSSPAPVYASSTFTTAVSSKAVSTSTSVASYAADGYYGGY